jgi:hypothetical protein
LYHQEGFVQSSASLQVPEQFSSVYELGRPTAKFPTGNASRWASAVTGVLLLGGAALTVIYGVYDVYVQTAKYGPAVFERTISAPACIAVLLFLIGAGLAISAFLNWNKAVVVYEKGLAYNDRRGLQFWRWEDVNHFFIAVTKHYYNGIPTGTTYVYTLKKADGSQIKLDNKFTKIQELGKMIQKNVFPFQYERLTQSLKNGQTVTLGAVALDKDGIAIGKKTFPWVEVEQVDIQAGFVSVKKKDGGWFSGASAPVASIPNLEAMLAVVDQVVKVKAG